MEVKRGRSGRSASGQQARKERKKLKGKNAGPRRMHFWAARHESHRRWEKADKATNRADRDPHYYRTS